MPGTEGKAPWFRYSILAVREQPPQPDPAEARRWYQRAADAGDTVAVVNLGLLPAEQDPAEARRWFERAADAGRTEAMICLSLLPAEQAWRQHVAEMGGTTHLRARPVRPIDHDFPGRGADANRAAEKDAEAQPRVRICRLRRLRIACRRRVAPGTAQA